MTEQPDRATGWYLVAAAKRGDTAAFGQLWADHHPMILTYLHKRVHDVATAEDLASDTFLRAWRSIDRVEDQGRAVGAWLVTIARNLVLDRAKSAAVSRSGMWPENEDGQRADFPDPEPEPGVSIPEQRNHRGISRRLDLYVSQLPRNQRECLRMRFTEGLSVEETAKRMGVNEGAAKAVQHRAIERLAEFLAHDGYHRASDFIDRVVDAA